MENYSAECLELLERARAGDQEALNALLARHRDRLRRMVEIHLDTRLQARLDASDVIQEAYVEVAERLQEYVERHSDLADDIREYFPAMAQVEQVKDDLREAQEPPATGPLPPLERLGDFRMLREIGHGGMGVVYEAEQISLGRQRCTTNAALIPSSCTAGASNV
jgi:hypothetical protein